MSKIKSIEFKEGSLKLDFSLLLVKAEENVTAAQLCLDNGVHDACANRAYYAIYQAALAMLAENEVKQ